MTKEEVKQAHPMREIVGNYGLRPNRAGFIPCPFHKEKTASLKVYEDSYYCFGCGASGDIFDFVQGMEGVSFKEAFLSLGGTYEDSGFASKLAVYQAQKRAEARRKAEEKRNQEKKLNHMLIDIYREYVNKSKPLSNVWCDCWNALQVQLYHHSELNGLESRW